MRITGDLIIRGNYWDDLRDYLIAKHELFARNVDFFVIALAIGVAADRQIEPDDTKIAFTITRDTYQTNDDLNDQINYLLKIAILTSTHMENQEAGVEMLAKIAFDEDYKDDNFSPTSFLIRFANYGAKKMLDICSDHDVDTADKLITMISDYIDGKYTDTALESGSLDDEGFE
jgi:hypothetical protein